ncbi:hypothetical protein B0T22DRAFT_438857 [Podospora appendiculata]|uniref:Uncharacterized protein n=1 Tax=Podospora appendiculata TaxID=314037 RepID=A0AAE0X6T5_9PEZI|nr:hypothetical protein B0T22DRAFT_438857 [Podospora appendiculata]
MEKGKISWWSDPLKWLQQRWTAQETPGPSHPSALPPRPSDDSSACITDAPGVVSDVSEFGHDEIWTLLWTSDKDDAVHDITPALWERAYNLLRVEEPWWIEAYETVSRKQLDGIKRTGAKEASLGMVPWAEGRLALSARIVVEMILKLEGEARNSKRRKIKDATVSTVAALEKLSSGIGPLLAAFPPAGTVWNEVMAILPHAMHLRDSWSWSGQACAFPRLSSPRLFPATTQRAATICYFFFTDTAAQQSATATMCALLHQLFVKNPRLATKCSAMIRTQGRMVTSNAYALGEIWKKASSLDEAGDEIKTSSSSTYLWVKIIFGLLERNEDDRRSVWKQLVDDLPDTISAAYEKLLGAVKDKDMDLVAKEVPSGLREKSTSRRTMTALSGTWIRKGCNFFVTVQDGTLGLVHPTAYEWLRTETAPTVGVYVDRTKSEDEGLVDEEVSSFDVIGRRINTKDDIWNRVDADYLGFSHHELEFEIQGGGRDTTPFKSSLEQMMDKFGFLEYPARNWSSHFRRIVNPRRDHDGKELDLVNKAVGILGFRRGRGNFLAWYQFSAAGTVDVLPKDYFPYQTPLKAAIQAGVHDFIPLEQLLQSTDVNLQDWRGQTALHLAVNSRSHDLVYRLLTDMKPGDQGIQDAYGRTALHYAVLLQHSDLHRILREVEASLESLHRSQTAKMWKADRQKIRVFIEGDSLVLMKAMETYLDDSPDASIDNNDQGLDDLLMKTIQSYLKNVAAAADFLESPPDTPDTHVLVVGFLDDRWRQYKRRARSLERLSRPVIQQMQRMDLELDDEATDNKPTV